MRTQPGGRNPAPGALAVVQAFINTRYDLEYEHGAEVLATPVALSRWLAQAGLAADQDTADARDLERALLVREGLRSLARGGSNLAAVAARLDEAARGASVEVRFGEPRAGETEWRERGPRFVASPGAGVCGAVGVLLAVATRSMADGTWSRLKICPGDTCGWAFYDHSRNRSGRWCAMSVCGGRAKARSHYRRRRAREP